MGPRIGMLMAAGEDIGAPEALRIGLDQAVAGVGGLGGMAHLGGGGSGHLYLATRCGLSEALTEAWKRIGGDEPVAPALAVRDNTAVWTPLPGDTETGNTGSRGFPVGTGLASVPMPAARGPQGALSVLTAARDGPGPAERTLLTAVAGWVSERLHEPAPRRAARPAGPGPPAQTSSGPGAGPASAPGPGTSPPERGTGTRPRWRSSAPVPSPPPHASRSGVSDGSPATPRIRRAGELDEGGRGLQLVAALAHRWGARCTAQGKCIWAEQLLT